LTPLDPRLSLCIMCRSLWLYPPFISSREQQGSAGTTNRALGPLSLRPRVPLRPIMYFSPHRCFFCSRSLPPCKTKGIACVRCGPHFRVLFSFSPAPFRRVGTTRSVPFHNVFLADRILAQGFSGNVRFSHLLNFT